MRADRSKDVDVCESVRRAAWAARRFLLGGLLGGAEHFQDAVEVFEG